MDSMKGNSIFGYYPRPCCCTRIIRVQARPFRFVSCPKGCRAQEQESYKLIKPNNFLILNNGERDV